MLWTLRTTMTSLKRLIRLRHQRIARDQHSINLKSLLSGPSTVNSGNTPLIMSKVNLASDSTVCYHLDWFEELNTPFHEHIFLSRHVNAKTGAGSPGPLKSFMELVCAGLAKNPYISAKEKADHLTWFQGYFHAKVKDIEAAVEEERRIKESELQTKKEQTP